MDCLRRNKCQSQRFARLPCPPPTGGWKRPSKDLSYPVTIDTVQELGENSLFIKWNVHNFGNIGGYEIFLDGYLTNRYFNCLHRAAVICEVDLRCPHRIILRAQPLLPLRNSSCFHLSTANTKRPSNATTTTTTHLEASCPQSDGSVWYPSVYHFEPNL
ncbi:uncharacterized protein LOC129943066 [Eupeodes corollae]|uniref:uncharacterized protein LOC129943066 n=1 Tax=Eupeodes corollae TaxID=290404 RepID=UPI002490FCDD|nr:uncharacterized protein LOC129943066 [Eupeodes corollae]